LAASVEAGDRASVAVEFVANGNVIGRVTAPPYQLTISNIVQGDYRIFARAIDDFGLSDQSDSVWVRIQLPPADVRFLGVDDFTQGAWKGRYGRDGSWLASLQRTLAAPLSIDAKSNQVFVWSWAAESASNALETTIAGQRIASCWVNAQTLEFDLAVNDGQPRQLALYFLDWDSGARYERVDLLDAAAGTLLDSREVRWFSQGRYLLYRIRGQVRVRVTRLQSNTVLSAFFFDPAPSLYHEWQMQSFPTQWNDDAVAGELANPDSDRFNNFLEFSLGLNPLEPEATPYQAVTRNGQNLELTFRRLAGNTVQFGFQTSFDLKNWQPAGDQIRTIDVVPEGQYERVTVRLSTPGSIGFLRLTVERP